MYFFDVGLCMKLAVIIGIWVSLSMGALSLAAQSGPPPSDIYLVDIERNNGEMSFSQPRAITHQPGYDNQPAFIADGSALLYVSIRDDEQADVYRYDIASASASRITNTPESEFSPTPLSDGYFSVVRVEADDSTQRVWRFDAHGTALEPVLKSVHPVGYHCWIDDKRLALFILGEPHALYEAQIGSEEKHRITGDIGRCIQRIPNSEAVSFVHKVSDSVRTIKSYNPATGAVATLINTLPGSEDYVWTSDGRLLMGANGTLYIADPRREQDWRAIADFTESVGNFNRLALSPDGNKLALVAFSQP